MPNQASACSALKTHANKNARKIEPLCTVGVRQMGAIRPRPNDRGAAELYRVRTQTGEPCTCGGGAQTTKYTLRPHSVGHFHKEGYFIFMYA